MNKIYINITLGLLLLLGSCSGTLDHEDLGYQTPEVIFANRFKIETFKNMCLNIGVAGPDIHSASVTDEAFAGNYFEDASFQNWYDGTITSTSFLSWNRHGGNPWDELFSYIRRCNIFLKYIDEETAGLIDDERNGWKAQVYAMRSYYIWMLAKRYGDIPLSLEMMGAEHDFTTDKKIPFGEVVKQIISDGELVMEIGPESISGYPWSFVSKLEGQLTKGGVHAIMSQAVTYAVSPLWDDGTFTKEEAAKITGRSLSECLAHGYELFKTESPDAVNAYANYFYSVDNSRTEDKETIFRVGGRIGMWDQVGLPTTPGQVNSGPCPTQNLVDAYEMQSTGLAPITGYSDKEKLIPIVNTASGYDPENPYEGRDPRFYATVFYNSAAVDPKDPNGRKVESYLGGGDAYRQNNRKYSYTGYYTRKYAHPGSKQGTHIDGTMRVFRLAELYFNFAETAYQAYGPDQAVDIGRGMKMSAREAVNTVRARSQMPPIPTGLTKEAFEKVYRNERRVELAFEAHRFFDIRRWKVLSDETFISGIEITRDDNSKYSYKRIPLGERKSNTDKFLIFPIHPAELRIIFKQTGEQWQNPGWDY